VLDVVSDHMTGLAPERSFVVSDQPEASREEVVKSAEKCTAQIIHPGLPRDRSAKDIDKWIKRGEKFN